MKVIDLTYVNNVTMGDKELEKELFQIFLGQIPEFSSTFDHALAEKDWLKIAATAHKAKASILAMGMEHLGGEMKNLEILCKSLFLKNAGIFNKQKSRIKKELEAISPKQKTWLEANNSEATVLQLIEFYNLQMEMAKQDIREVSGEAS